MSWAVPSSGVGVVVVEPYASARGHYARSLTEAAEALTLMADRVVAVGDQSPLVSARLRRVSRSSAARMMRGLGALRAGLLRVGGSRASSWSSVAWCSRQRERVRFLGDELPVLWAARRAGRRLRDEGRDTYGLVTSSFVRPFWLKPALVGLPTAELVFESSRAPERLPPRRRWRPRLAATSAAVGASVRDTVAGARVERLAHFPLVAPGEPVLAGDAPGPDAVIPESMIGADLRNALAAWRADGRRWGLVFGTGHVKKNLPTLLDAVDHLEATRGLALVGRLGAKVEPEVRRRLMASEVCVVVDRYVTDIERRWLFGQADAVVLCDRAGTVSVSGSLLDAVAARCPVVAPAHTESGRLVRDVGLGLLYDPDDAAGLAATVGRVLCDSATRSLNERALRDEGLLAAPAWARVVMELLGP